LKSYYSYTGGLITPDCCDNPLGYKFTWSPVSVFRALLGNATYLKDGKKCFIPSKKLLHSCKPIHANKALNLVGFPNRDAMSYQKLYGLENVDTFIRGTLRYKGFSEIVGSWMDLGVIDDHRKIPSSVTTWVQLFALLSQDCPSVTGFESLEIDIYVAEVAHRNGLDYGLLSRITKKFMSDSWSVYSEGERLDRVKCIYEGYEWFAMLDPKKKLPANEKNMGMLEMLATELQERLTMKPGEMDLIVMIHFFKVLYPKSGKVEVIKSSMVQSGSKDGLSGMSLTVGTPVAIAVRLVLEGKIQAKGVLRPIIPEVYRPISAELKTLGVFCKEEVVKTTEILPRL
jgi:saccharopine dehydrogenase-like NADP-dependent oxidoreductase